MSERFLVASLGEDGAWLTPVRVRCTACNGYSPPFGGTDGLKEDQVPGEASLPALSSWAVAHQCGPALPPEAWARAAQEAQAQLKAAGVTASLDACNKAFAGGLMAVWADVRGRFEAAE